MYIERRHTPNDGASGEAGGGNRSFIFHQTITAPGKTLKRSCAVLTTNHSVVVFAIESDDVYFFLFFLWYLDVAFLFGVYTVALIDCSIKCKQMRIAVRTDQILNVVV